MTGECQVPTVEPITKTGMGLRRCRELAAGAQSKGESPHPKPRLLSVHREEQGRQNPVRTVTIGVNWKPP